MVSWNSGRMQRGGVPRVVRRNHFSSILQGLHESMKVLPSRSLRSLGSLRPFISFYKFKGCLAVWLYVKVTSLFGKNAFTKIWACCGFIPTDNKKDGSGKKNRGPAFGTMWVTVGGPKTETEKEIWTL